MTWTWLWQDFLSNAIWYFLILLGGVVLTFLKKRGSAWFAPALYGLVGCSLVAVIVYSVVALNNIPPKKSPPVSPDNVEANIRTWLDRFGLSVAKGPDESDTIFSLFVTLRNGVGITIWRPKSLDRYVVLATLVSIKPSDQDVVNQLSPEETARFTARIRAEMARVKLIYTAESPLRTITLQKRIPITDNLTEDVFMQAIDEVNSAALLVLETMDLELIGKRTAESAPAKKSRR
jgi:hypothetical protein